jgi:hypothetical protein
MTVRTGLLAVAVVFLIAPAASAQSVTASCDTPPTNRDGCNHWYTTASVTLDWAWSPGGTTTGCAGGTFTAEGRVERSCLVEWPDTSLSKKIWIGIDRTPPVLVSLHPAHRPNANGWFNRPVQLTFVGDDETSGVASCSSTTYGGPDGVSVPISGSCTDVAGNVGSGVLPINYDSTSPRRPSVEVMPGNKRVSVKWSAPAGVVAEVVRARKGGKRVVVFQGAGTRLTDRRLRNGRRYRYFVTLVDPAGNSSTGRASAVPTSSPLLLPARGAHVHGAPTLVWKPARRARYYNAQLFYRGRKLLTRWPEEPRLQLQKLEAGRYCWYVWPGFGKRAAHRYGRLLGKSCFTVVAG